MKKLLVITVLFTAVSQIEAINTTNGIKQACARGYKVQPSAQGYQCVPNAHAFCSKGYQVQAMPSNLLGTKKGSYLCKKLLQS